MPRTYTQGERVMRAKLQVGSVIPNGPDGTPPTSETVHMHAVCKEGAYPVDGSDENNTFARFSPSAAFSIHIANPALFGKHKVGDQFYVDFSRATPVEDAPAAPAADAQSV